MGVDSRPADKCKCNCGHEDVSHMALTGVCIEEGCDCKTFLDAAGRCGGILFDGPGERAYSCSRWRLHDGGHRTNTVLNKGGQGYIVEWFDGR